MYYVNSLIYFSSLDKMTQILFLGLFNGGECKSLCTISWYVNKARNVMYNLVLSYCQMKACPINAMWF